MLGATGAVGNHAAVTLAALRAVGRLTLLGRRAAANVAGLKVSQRIVDIFAPSSYDGFLAGHDAAVCALGVGQPSTISRDEFVRIDHDAVLAFAAACRRDGVRHFALLSSVGVSAKSRSFFLRTKGELEAALIAMEFERLSLFHPSMILTPTNRYGVSQAIALAVTRLISPLLWGPLRKFRGIDASALGRAMALNTCVAGSGVEVLHWDECMRLAAR